MRRTQPVAVNVNSRYHYTAHGDAINIASRLAGANKTLGTRICMSAETASRVPQFNGRPVGTLWLKGKRRGTEAFELLGLLQDRSAEHRAYMDAFNLLKAADPGAPACFKALNTSHPEDALVRFHHHRLMAGESGTEIVLDEKG